MNCHINSVTEYTILLIAILPFLFSCNSQQITLVDYPVEVVDIDNSKDTIDVIDKKTPVVFYLQNLPLERLGTDSDIGIISDLKSDGFLVISVDCGKYSNTSPELEEDLMEFHLESPVLLSSYENDSLIVDYDRIFYVPAGYRIERNIPVWNVKEHGAEGTLNHIMEVYNDYIVKTFDVNAVSSPNDMVGPNGESLEYNLFMDIIYPSGKLNVKVPTLINFASTLPRQKPFNPRNKLEVAFRSLFPLGFITSGYAFAHVDHCYNPLARDIHYQHFGRGSLDSYNGLYSSRAFIRYLRKFSSKYNLNEKFGVMGFSKSSYSATRIMDSNNAEQEERLLYDKGPNNKPQPWEGYSSNISVGYTAAGFGVTWIPDYVDYNTCPLITSVGKFDSYNQWNKYSAPIAYLEENDINHLSFWMEDLGHTFPCMGIDYATGENRYSLFKRFFDFYLKPKNKNELNVFYAYPKDNSIGVDAYGYSRTLPLDNLLPKEMNGVSPYSPITVRFLNEMDTVGIKEHLKVIDEKTKKSISGTWKVSLKNRVFEFYPKTLLETNKSYILKVSNTISDIDGNKLESDFTRVFVVIEKSFITDNF